MAVNLQTASEVRAGIASRFKFRRLAANLSQQELARRSGVSLGSLKRFERQAQISLGSLLNLAMVLNCQGDFENLAAGTQAQPVPQSLDVFLKTSETRQRATGSRVVHRAS